MINATVIRSVFAIFALLVPLVNTFSIRELLQADQPSDIFDTGAGNTETGETQTPDTDTAEAGTVYTSTVTTGAEFTETFPVDILDTETLDEFDHHSFLPYIHYGSGTGGGGGGQPPAPSGPTIIDHNSIALFERIPERYLTTARGYRMLFADRSVGQNINESLDCLTASSWATSSSSCRRDYYSGWNWKTYTQTDLSAGTVPSRISFTPSPTRYNRSNWTYDMVDGTWYSATEKFITELAPRYLNSKDVLSYQLSYLTIGEDSGIASPTEGFFVNNANRYDIYDLEAFWEAHPNKTFFLWTTSLARGAGTAAGRDFNNQMRQYGIDHNMFVFDVAAIESHTDRGVACFDNRDGVQYCGASGCENHPNDGLALPAICQDYTTEIDGGHLGSVSAGRIRLAKAFWVLMARMAGWDGQSQ